MTVFEFQAPDGRSVQIDGPDQQGALQAFNMYGKGLLDKTASKEQSLSWSDVGSQALQNIPSSAVHFGKDVVTPFIHPLDTLESVGKVSAGLAEKTGLLGRDDEEPYANAVGEFFKNRYGGLENLKKTMATDPVGFVADLSTLLTAGGGALARAPGVAGKIGEIAATVGDATNPLSGVAKAAGAAGRKLGVGTEAAPVAVPATEDLHAAADAAYSHPSIKELSVRPRAVQSWRDDTSASLDDDGFTAELAPRTHGVLRHIDRLAADGPISGARLETVRKMLGRAASVNDLTDRAAAMRVKESLDDFVDKLPDGSVLRGDPKKVSSVLSDARGNYAAAKRSGDVENAVDRAELNAASANSGQNLDNAMRQRIKAILASPKASRGYSKDELDQMRRVVTGTFTGDVARHASNMLGKGGGLAAAFMGVEGARAGFSAGGLPGAALGASLPAVGYAFSKLSNAITKNEVEKLQTLIRSRSPLARQMEAPLKKFGEADVAYRAKPSPRTFSTLLMASRNLSNNLTDAGISVAPESLVGASNEQQPTPEQQAPQSASLPPGVYPVQ